MGSHPLQRTAYRDPKASNDLVNRLDQLIPDPADPNAEVAERSVEETDRDLENYVRPAELIHGSGLHAWGVASGLAVTMTNAGDGLVIEPGVAIDAAGHHISLAVGTKNAELSRTPKNNPPEATKAGDVLPEGVTLPIKGMGPPELAEGTYYLMIHAREAYELSSTPQAAFTIWRHMPWLNLVKEADAKLDGSDGVPLAEVTLDAGLKVIGLAEVGRRPAAVPAGALLVRGARKRSNRVGEHLAGEIRASARARGLDITVAGGGYRIEFKQSLRADDGVLYEGGFGELAVRAAVTACGGDGSPTVELQPYQGDVLFSGALRDLNDRTWPGLDIPHLRLLTDLLDGKETTLHDHPVTLVELNNLFSGNSVVTKTFAVRKNRAAWIAPSYYNNNNTKSFIYLGITKIDGISTSAGKAPTFYSGPLTSIEFYLSGTGSLQATGIILG